MIIAWHCIYNCFLLQWQKPRHFMRKDTEKTGEAKLEGISSQEMVSPDPLAKHYDLILKYPRMFHWHVWILADKNIGVTVFGWTNNHFELAI